MALRTLIVDLVGNVEKLRRDFDGAAKDVRKFVSGIEAIGTGVKSALGVGLGAAALAGIKKINDLTLSMARAGEEAGSLRDAFISLGGDTRQIDNARKAVLGMVDSFELMQIANTALVAGFPKLADNFGAVADVGARLADTLGKDTKESVVELTDAILKANEKALRPYGIAIDKTQSLEERRNSALRQAIELQGRLAPVTDSVTNAQDALAKTVGEVVKNVGIQINQNPQLTQAFRDLAEAVNGVDWKRFGDDLAAVSTVIVNAGTTIISTFEKMRQAIDDLNLADRVITQGGLANGDKFAKQLFDEQEVARLQKRLQAISSEMGKVGGKSTANLSKEWELLWQQAQTLSATMIEKVKPAFDAVKESLKTHQPVAKKTVFDFGSIDIAAGKLEKTYKELNIAQHVTSNFVRSQLEPVLQNLHDTFQGGTVFQSQYIEMLEQMRNAFTLAGGSAEDFDSVLSSIKDKKPDKITGGDRVAGSLFGINITEGFAQELGASLTQAFSTLANAIVHGGEAKQVGGQIGNSIGGAVGGAIGASFVSAGTAAAVAAGTATMGQLMTSALLPGIGAVIGAVGGQFLGEAIGGLFGGSKNAETQARKDIVNFLEQSLKGVRLGFQDSEGLFREFTGNFILGENTRFSTEGWGAAFDEMDGKAKGVFLGLGEALEELVGTTENVGSQIGLVLAENLSGNIDNARLLVQALGLKFEDLEEKMVAAGLAGEMTWHEVEVALQGIGEAFQPGREAVGDIVGAFDEILSSGGRGLLALKGLRDLAIEALEDGMTSLDELKASLMASGQFAQEDIDAAFQALGQRGITSLEALAEVSNRVGGGIVADMESLGVQFEDLAKNVEEVANALSSIEDNVSKNLHFDISTSLDGNTVKAIDGGVFKSGGVSVALPNQVSAFAKGGVVNTATMFGHSGGLGLMGEAGPEGILPLKRIHGKLGVSAEGMMGGGTTYYVDARGASPGVERVVLNALKQVEDRATRRALRAMGDSMARGSFDF